MSFLGEGFFSSSESLFFDKLSNEFMILDSLVSSRKFLNLRYFSWSVMISLSDVTVELIEFDKFSIFIFL